MVFAEDVMFIPLVLLIKKQCYNPLEY